MTGVIDWVDAGMSTIAGPPAGGNFRAARDGRQDHFFTTCARQFLPRHVPAGLTRTGMTGLRALVVATGELLVANRRANMTVVLLAAGFLTLVPATGHLFVASPVANKDPVFQSLALDRLIRSGTLALDPCLQLAGTTSPIVAVFGAFVRLIQRTTSQILATDCITNRQRICALVPLLPIQRGNGHLPAGTRVHDSGLVLAVGTGALVAQVETQVIPTRQLLVTLFATGDRQQNVRQA